MNVYIYISIFLQKIRLYEHHIKIYLRGFNISKYIININGNTINYSFKYV